jgi:lipoprotein LprG
MKLRYCLMPLIMLLLLATVACREATEEESTPTPAPTPTPDPRLILQQAGERMQALESARFEMARTGGPVYLDPERQFLFNSATGQYAAPESVRAVIRVQAAGLALEVNTIAIGDEQWLTNPLTRRWDQLPPGWGFNPAIIFDPEQGWQPLVREDITDLTLPEQVQVDGRTLQYIRGSVTGERVRVITAGLAGDEPVDVAFWIDPNTLHVVRIQFSTTSEGQEPSVWLLTFSDFDAPVTIERPPAN